MKACLIAIFFLYAINALGQSSELEIKEPKNLLYYVDGENTFLIPLVEDFLKELQFTETRKPMFNEVQSLNLYRKGKNIRTSLYETIRYYNRNGSINSKEKQSHSIDSAIQIDKKIADKFESNQLLLFIHINQHGSIFEYQLVLFRFTLESATFVNPDFSMYRATSVLIDPQRDNYKQELRSGLKSLFKEANDKPKPLLISTSHRIFDNKIIVGINDTLRLEADVIDDDSPRDKIRYNWEFPESSRDKNFLINSEKKKEIIFYDSGRFKFELRVSDGISDFVSQRYEVIILPKPAIRGVKYAKTSGLYDETFWKAPVYFRSNRADIFTYPNAEYHYRNSVLNFSIDIDDSVDRLDFVIKDNFDGKNAVINVKEVSAIENVDVLKKAINPSIFNIFIVSTEAGTYKRDSIFIFTPSEVNIPSLYEVQMTAIRRGLKGEPSSFQLNFHHKRRAYVHYAYDFIFSGSSFDLVIKGGIGYSLYSGAASLNVDQGFYVIRNTIEENYKLSHFQDAYVQVQLPNKPVSLKIGIRNNVFDYTEDMITERQRAFYLVTGCDFVIYRKLFDQRISYTMAINSKSQIMTLQMSLGFTMDFHFEKRWRGQKKPG
jgi:hypothetical protein